MHFLLEVKVNVQYLLKGKIHRRLRRKMLLYTFPLSASHLLSILAPAFSLPINVLHFASSCHDLHVVLFLFSFKIYVGTGSYAPGLFCCLQ